MARNAREGDEELVEERSRDLLGNAETAGRRAERPGTVRTPRSREIAVQKLLDMLPPELRETYADVLAEDKDGDIYPLVKAADKLSAYIKCIEERKAGNNEFLSAEAQTRAALDASPLPEVQYFLQHFIPAFERDLDELGAIGQ